MTIKFHSTPLGPILFKVLAVVAILFGLLTLFSGGSVLFGGEAERIAAGNYVGFVVLFNFLAGFAYIVAGGGLWAKRRWAVWLSAGIALATLLVFAAFGIHVWTGGMFETKTVGAMVLRSGMWVIMTLAGLLGIPRSAT